MLFLSYLVKLIYLENIFFAMSECIFCKIANGEIPSFKLFEDDDVLAFLDVNPVSEGHLLVIPKDHHENIFEIPEEKLRRISEVCKDMSMLCKEKLGATGVNVLNASGKDAQQSVFHIHFHVIPRSSGDGLDLQFHGRSLDSDKMKEIQKTLLS